MDLFLWNLTIRMEIIKIIKFLICIILCPNCHALTETYRGKNKETYKNIPVDEKSFVEALQTTPNIRQALIKLNLSPAGANYSRAKELLNKYQIIQKDI